MAVVREPGGKGWTVVEGVGFVCGTGGDAFFKNIFFVPELEDFFFLFGKISLGRNLVESHEHFILSNGCDFKEFESNEFQGSFGQS